MKKFLPIIIVGLMLASFIGCTPKNEEADTTEESVTDEILDLEVDTEIPAFDFDQSELPAIGEEIAIMKTSMGDIYIRLLPIKHQKQ